MTDYSDMIDGVFTHKLIPCMTRASSPGSPIPFNANYNAEKVKITGKSHGLRLASAEVHTLNHIIINPVISGNWLVVKLSLIIRFILIL